MEACLLVADKFRRAPRSTWSGPLGAPASPESRRASGGGGATVWPSGPRVGRVVFFAAPAKFMGAPSSLALARSLRALGSPWALCSVAVPSERGSDW